MFSLKMQKILQNFRIESFEKSTFNKATLKLSDVREKIISYYRMNNQNSILNHDLKMFWTELT